MPDVLIERREYRAKLEAMTDAELLKATGQMIWLSAYAHNNPRSAYHWQCDATYDEAVRRGKPELYQRAYDRIARDLTG